MPKLVMQEHDPNAYKTLPADTMIQVEVADIKEREVTSTKGNWMKLEFKFVVTDIPDALMEEYAEVVGSNIWGSVSARFSEHPDNKLRHWAEALFGIELTVGYELDTDDLLGKKARAAVTNYTKRDGGTAHQVGELFPLGNPFSNKASAPSAPTNANGTTHTIKEDPWSPTPVAVGAQSNVDDIFGSDDPPF